MARRDAPTDPKDQRLISPTTEPTEGRGAVVDPDGGDPDPGHSPVVGSDADGISLADPRPSPSPIFDFTKIDIGGPASVDDHAEITEEAPEIGSAPEVTSPLGGSTFYDGVDGESIEGVDGESFGSTLLDDLGGGTGLPDPTDGGGEGPAIDDQTGWASDLPSGLGDPSGEHQSRGDDEVEHQNGTQPQSGDDGVDAGQTPGNYGTPAPDDGTGGDPDEGDFIGGRGDVDSAPETKDHGGAGAFDTVAAGQGAVDFDSDLDDAGAVAALDMERAGMGAIDPLDGDTELLGRDADDLEGGFDLKVEKGELPLLGDDAGDLADMGTDADLVVIALEVDDSLVDADIGEDV